MTGRHDRSDGEWTLIAPLFTEQTARVGAADDRPVINGTFYLLCSAHQGALARLAGALRTAHHGLRGFRTAAAGVAGLAALDRQFYRARPPTCRREIAGGLEVPGCDASVGFQTIEGALNEIAAAMERRIDRADDADVALARDVSGGAQGLDGRDDRLAKVAGIGDGGVNFGSQSAARATDGVIRPPCYPRRNPPRRHTPLDQIL